jgi:iron complex outermembrane receptor protein
VARDPTASATVIEADRFAGEAKGVAELVATAPGVAVSEYGGLGHISTISIRGATADGVLVLLDGIPLNSAFGGGVDLSSIPRQWIERIEVVRGVEGAVYGAGALGGVVNVVTRRAATGGSAEVGAGSFDTYTASWDRSVSLGTATLRIAASADTTSGEFPYRWAQTPDDPTNKNFVDAIRENNAATRVGGLVALRVPLGAPTLDVVAQLSGARRELPGSPYALTPHDRQDDGRALLSARLSGPVARGLVLAATGTGRLDLLDLTSVNGDSRQRGGAAGLECEARWTHGPGLLRVAVEGKRETLENADLGERRERDDLAVSVSEDVRIGDRLRVSPAARWDGVGPFDGVSAKLGAALLLAGPLGLRASGGQSFRAPTISELYLRQGTVAPNPNLVPEKGLGGDAALVLDSGPLFASVGGFATLYRDLIAYEPVSGGMFRPTNTGQALARGLEVEAASAPIRALAGLAVSASYTHLVTEILRGYERTVGNWVPHHARDRLYARASIAPGPATLHVEAHYVGRQFNDSLNERAIPAALVWNAGASLVLSRAHALRLHLELRNLLDDRTLQDALANPLPGRMVLVTLRAGAAATEGTP